MEKLSLKRKSKTDAHVHELNTSLLAQPPEQICDRHFKSLDEFFITDYHHVIPFRAARYSPIPSVRILPQSEH